MSRKQKVKKSSQLLVALLAGCLLTGCGPVAGEEEKLILTEKETEVITYEMAAVSISDVKKTGKARCVYQQVNDESLSFSVSGKRVAKVYVEKGENVTKGQILAELDIGNAKERIRDLEYNIARNELTLSNIELNRDNEISTLWLRFMYQSGQSQAEREAVEKNVEGIVQRYRYIQEDCEDALALDRTQLAILQKDVKESVLRAGMDGMVSDIAKKLEGSTTVRGEEVIKIIDSSECLFAVEDASLKEYFQEGVEVDMSMAYGTGAGDYKLMPYEMDKWEDVLLFTISQGGEDAIIEVGSMGTMRYTTGLSEQVLAVPLSAVHQADGNSFVYVLGENNMREMKWIETGLFGDDMVEVVSGLQEGERVIIK